MHVCVFVCVHMHASMLAYGVPEEAKRGHWILKYAGMCELPYVGERS